MAFGDTMEMLEGCLGSTRACPDPTQSQHNDLSAPRIVDEEAIACTVQCISSSIKYVNANLYHNLDLGQIQVYRVVLVN